MKKLLIIPVLLVSLVVAGCGQSEQYSQSQLKQLATCMTENNLVMYGTTRCQRCQMQKDMFGAAFSEVTFIDCDQSRIQCQAAGIQGFPTWIAADGQKYASVQDIEVLASIAGCEI